MTAPLTTLEYISRCQEVHGKEYDYSLVEYKNAKSKIKVICRKHGEFEVSPDSHKKGTKCKKCMSELKTNTNKKTTQDFKRDACNLWGDKYDYSRVIYKNNKTPVSIRHRECGTVFEQDPNCHLNRLVLEHCPICRKKQSVDYDKFIKKSIAIHGEKYDYSKIKKQKISGQKTVVTIICPYHGEFKMSCINHMSGRGCRECGKRALTKEDFVIKSKKVHGEKYGYDKVNYINSYTRVDIYCYKHKLYFSQFPNGHMSGKGCLECRIDSLKMTEEDLRQKIVKKIKESNSLLEYLGGVREEKVLYANIKCSIHGEILVRPNSFIQGTGNCPRCISGTSRNEDYLYEYLKEKHPNYNITQTNYIEELKGVGRKGGDLEIDIIVKYKDKVLYVEWNGVRNS